MSQEVQPAASVSAARHTADGPLLGVSATGARERLDLRFQGFHELANSQPRSRWLDLLGHLRHGLSDTHISRSGRPSREQRPARCWQQGAPARDRAPAAGYPRRPRSGTPRPPGPSIETAGRAPPPAGKDGATCVLLDRAGLGLRRWPAPAKHTRLRMTEGLRRARERLRQPP